jgi:hypothetical protein
MKTPHAGAIADTQPEASRPPCLAPAHPTPVPRPPPCPTSPLSLSPLSSLLLPSPPMHVSPLASPVLPVAVQLLLYRRFANLRGPSSNKCERLCPVWTRSIESASSIAIETTVSFGQTFCFSSSGMVSCSGWRQVRRQIQQENKAECETTTPKKLSTAKAQPRH